MGLAAAFTMDQKDELVGFLQTTRRRSRQRPTSLDVPFSLAASNVGPGWFAVLDWHRLEITTPYAS